MRKFYLLLFILIISALNNYGQKSNVIELIETRDSQNVKVVFEVGSFIAKQHKIQQTENQGTKIDGKAALGTDYSVPQNEIKSINLFFNGKKVSVAKELFSDCYNPNFEKDSVKLKFSDDGKSVMVFMAGSDGAGGYQIFWIFRNDGNHSRFSSAGSDTDYTDFINLFFTNK